MKRIFNPEFLNRVDDTIVFRALSKDDIFKIIDIQTRYLLKRLNTMSLSVEISEEAKSFLAEKGYDEKYGARPLRRTIQRYVEDELAELVLRGQFSEGGKVRVDYDKEKNALTFERMDNTPALAEPDGKAVAAPEVVAPEVVAEESTENGGKPTKKKGSKEKE
jgi:ATP-dependent Clp protease ATP-binding subunit ClpC